MLKRIGKKRLDEVWKRTEKEQVTDEDIRILSKNTELALEVLLEQVKNLDDRIRMLEVERETDITIGAEGEEVELRRISKGKVLELVKGYVNSHPGCLTSEIIWDLKLDIDLVLEALHKLENDKVLRGENIE